MELNASSVCVCVHLRVAVGSAPGRAIPWYSALSGLRYLFMRSYHGESRFGGAAIVLEKLKFL